MLQVLGKICNYIQSRQRS